MVRPVKEMPQRPESRVSDHALMYDYVMLTDLPLSCPDAPRHRRGPHELLFGLVHYRVLCARRGAHIELEVKFCKRTAPTVVHVAPSCGLDLCACEDLCQVLQQLRRQLIIHHVKVPALRGPVHKLLKPCLLSAHQLE